MTSMVESQGKEAPSQQLARSRQSEDQREGQVTSNGGSQDQIEGKREENGMTQDKAQDSPAGTQNGQLARLRQPQLARFW